MAPARTERCPRCGGSFPCGVDGPARCACSEIALDEATLAALRVRYRGCLCPRCLRELAAAPADETAVRTASPARPRCL